MTESIANVVLAALSGLKRLLETVRESDDLSLRASLLPRLDDELARLKVWAGNSGAHRTGRASLEHRLRDASHIRQQVLRLLNDLKDSIEDAADIMTGKATPWEETEDDEELLDDLEMETEMEQIALDITELVACLLRLSVSIQNPAPHDRFMSSTFTDTSAFEEFDIQHVQAKFQDIDKGLAQRLGKALSRRRQYFKYREAHHEKLSHGLDRHGDTNKTDAPSTLASSIPLHMKQEDSIDLSGDDTQSDGRASVTSFATSVSRPKTLKVPPIPAEALKGPFMCPFCYLIISVQDTKAWKKHVFGDLQPYNCLAVHCTAPDREFSRRNEWMQHMLQNHLRVYRCSYGCADKFSSAAESRGHFLRAHSGAIPESKVGSIVELSSQPLAQDANTECPFCSEKLKSLKHYRRHVGSHQQDLALFVLPNTEDAEDTSEESLSHSGEETDDIELDARDEISLTGHNENEDTDSVAESRSDVVGHGLGPLYAGDKRITAAEAGQHQGIRDEPPAHAPISHDIPTEYEGVQQSIKNEERTGAIVSYGSYAETNLDDDLISALDTELYFSAQDLPHLESSLLEPFTLQPGTNPTDTATWNPLSPSAIPGTPAYDAGSTYTSAGWEAISSRSGLSVSGGENTCENCGKSFGDARQARRHRTEVHREESDPQYVCKCSYQSYRKDNYLRHLSRSCKGRVVSGDEAYVCKCQKRFTDFDENLAHVRICGKMKVGRAPNRPDH